MPNWKKVITSGSDASLNSLDVALDITGSNALITNDLDVLGNVGIGTTSPSYPLDIQSNSTIALRLNNSSNSSCIIKSDNNYLHLESAGFILAGNPILAYEGLWFLNDKFIRSTESDGTWTDILGLDSSNVLKVGTLGNVSSGGDVAFLVSGAEKMRVAANGNVGIGTTSPNHKLSVAGGTIEVNNGGATWFGSDATGGFARTFNGNSFRFISSANSETMRINNATGNVGIGTTSPSKKLTVNGQTQFYEYSGAHLTNAAHSNFNFDTLANNSSSLSGGSLGAFIKVTASPTGATGTWSAIRSRAYGENTQGNTDNLINFFAEFRNYTSTNAVTLNHHAGLKVQSLGVGGLATVTNNYGVYLDVGTAATNNYGVYQVGTSVKNFFQGNVGIGTTSPSQKLHVEGNARVTGAYYDSGNTPGTVNQLLASTATGTSWIDPSTITAEAASLVVIACKNTSGATITKGTPVYQTGNVGATATIEIAPADALISANKLPAIGVLQTDLNNNGLGNVVITGELTNFTTDPIDGVTPTVGDKIFVKSGGGLTLTKPTGEGNGIQNMGLVGKVSGGNAGSITVSSIMRTNDVPNLPEGRIWVGDGNTIVSDTVYIDEPNNRLGIGTSSPAEKLHVFGGAAAIEIDSTTNEASLKYDNSTTTATIKLANNDLKTELGGSEVMRILANGNVGIGTTNPLYGLHVERDAIYLAGASNLTQLLITKIGSVNKEGSYIASDNSRELDLGIWDNGSTPAGIKIYAQNNVISNSSLEFITGGTARINVNGSGNVGIGTTSPEAKLDVESEILISGTDPILRMERGDGFNSDILKVESSTDNLIIGDTSLDDIIFEADNGEAMRIDGAGNVGIGTTSPSTKLEVISAANEEGIAIKDSSGNLKYKIRQFGGNSYSTFWDSTNTEKVRITSGGSSFFNGGNVGISTTAPSHKLHLEGLSTSAIGFGGTNLKLGDYTGIGTTRIYSNGLYLSYSTANSYHDFTNAGSSLMRINPDGNVGIGTTSPSTKLHVFEAGTSMITVDSGATAPYKAGIEFLRSSINGGSIYNDGNNVQIKFDSYFGYDSANPSRGGFQFRTAPVSNNTMVDAVRIDALGSVGIGTTTPSEKLQVNNGKLYITESANASTANLIYLENSGSGGNEGVSIKFNPMFDAESMIASNREGAASDNANLTFHTALADVTTERMRITSSGNIGIGTTAPEKKLHVAGGDVLINNGQYYTAKNNTGANYKLAAITTGNQVAIGAIDYTSAGTIFAGGDNVSITTGGVAGSSRLKILSNGNVGIGTTNPTQKLDVAGSIRTNSNLYVYNSDLSRQTLKVNAEATTNTGILKLSNGSNWGLLIRGESNTPLIGSYFSGGLNITGFEDSSGTTTSAIKLAQFVFGGTGGGSGYLTLNGDLKVNNNKKIKFGYANSQENGIEWIAGSKVSAAITPVDTANFSRTGLGFFTGDFSDGTTNADERMRITRAGNVGIGITVPLHNLSIEGTSSSLLKIRNTTNGGGAAIEFNDNSSAATSQNGTLTYYHQDGVSQGGGASWHFESEPDTVLVVGSSTVSGRVVVKDGGGTTDVAYGFYDDIDTGMYRAGADSLRLVAGGVSGVSVSTTGVGLRYAGSTKIITSNSGITVTGTATATTFSGDLNGTINTATTAVTKPNATDDDTVATTAFVKNLIETIPAGLVFQGTWNADTNTPTLANGTGTTGHFYIVSTEGSTNLDGITDWKVGDWAVFVEQGATDAWEKVDNSSVLDGSGTGQTVALWGGSGTSNTLTDAPITVSGNNTTFAGGLTGTYGAFSENVNIQGTGNLTIRNTTSTGSGIVFIDTTWQAGIEHQSGKLFFRTGGQTDRMVINGSGNVGIGTTSPSEKLEVLGNVKLADNNKLLLGTGSDLEVYHDGSNSYINQTGTGKIIIQSTSGINIQSGTGETRFTRSGVNSEIKVDDSAQVNKVVLKSAGDSYFNGGNVGIGTTTPSSILDINGGSANGVNIQAANTGTEYVFNAKTSNGTSRLWVGGAGNVGIGTTTPSEILQVGNDSVGSNYIQIAKKDNTDAGIKISETGSSRIGFLRVNPSENLEIGTESTNDVDIFTNGVSRVTIDGDNGATQGYVGIGTTSPSAKLDIEGDLQVKGVNISNQENLDVDTGTETIATVAIADYDAAFFDYVIKNGTDLRAGTVFAVHNGTSVEFTETSTSDLGNTSRVTLSVDISGADMRLRATATSDDWIVKSLVRAI